MKIWILKKKYLIPAAMVVILPLAFFGWNNFTASDIREAYNAADNGNWGLAGELFQSAAENHPDHPELWEQAGLAAIQENDIVAGMEFFQAAFQFGGITEIGILLWTDLEFEAGKPEFAINVLETWLESSEDSVQGWRKSAVLKQQVMEFEGAKIAWEKVLEIESTDLEASLALGILNFAYDLDESRRNLQFCVSFENSYMQEAQSWLDLLDTAEISEDRAHSLVIIGQKLAAEGRWGLATEVFTNAIKISPEYAEAWAFLGQSQNQAGFNGSESLRNGLVLDPFSFSGNLFMGIHIRSQNNAQKALEYFEFAAELEPLNPNVQVEIGQTWLVLADLEKASEAFQNAINLSPFDSQLHLIMAEFSLRYDYFLSSIGMDAAKEAIRIDPGDIKTNLMLARVFAGLGELVSAQEYFHKALEIDKENQEVLYYLGLFYFDAGFSQHARDAFETVLDIAPESYFAAETVQILEKYFP